MALVVFVSLQLSIPTASGLNGLELLKSGSIMAIILLVLSQLIFSSVMRLSYELLFCLVPLLGILLSNTFLVPVSQNLPLDSKDYQELWDLLKFITPICIGLPILMGGGGFITAFYQREQDVVRKQLYRHITMAAYFEIGAVLFLNFPILKRIIAASGTM